MKYIALVTLGSTIAACSSSSTPPTRDQYDDTAQAIASTTASGSGASAGGGDVVSMADSVTLALGTLPSGLALQANGHVQGARLGVDYSYTVTCKTLAGVTLVACDHSTNAASVSVAWSGQLVTPSITATVRRDGMWSVTGLQTATATFSGDSTFSIDSTLTSIFRPGVTATYMFDATASYDAVLISTGEQRVTGGTATFDVTAHHTVTGSGGNTSDGSFEVNAVLTFHADHTADVVLDGTQHYTLDLTTGLIVRI